MITVLRQLLQKFTGPLKPFVFLVVRILVGYAFFRAGWEKLMEYDLYVGRFVNMGIPVPEVNVVVVGVFESLVGLAVMAGLATRLASAIGIVIMLVAILSVHLPEMKQLFSDPAVVVSANPMPYVLVFAILAVTGPGKLSVDKAIGLEGDD